MKILGIETSCDETAVAVVENGRKVLSDLVFSQTGLHAEYFGVVPEISARAHLEKINPLIDEALAAAGLGLGGIDAIAVTNRPGLIGSLIIGVSTAKVLSWVLARPFVGVNHVVAHLYASFLTDDPPEFPFIGLVVSGGHTLLLKVLSWDAITILGTTIDDAAGEAFDKVAKILGLGYPGGPFIDRIAETGDPVAVPLPEINMYNKRRNNFDFSYSGLKTAVLYHMKKHPATKIEDMCASFRRAAIEILVKKSFRLCRQEGLDRLVIGGGVAANSYLRIRFAEEGRTRGVKVHCPPARLTTDNAAMIAGLGYHSLVVGRFDLPDLNAYSENDLSYAKGVLR